MLSILAGITCKETSAQQQSIVKSYSHKFYFNRSPPGISFLINDTISDWGGWSYKINAKVVKQYANVRDINLDFRKNYKSCY